MTVHQVNWRGKIVGSFDDVTKTYSKICDYDKGQIYRLPKYRQAVGISRDLIRFLVKSFGEIRWFKWQIINLPGEKTFEAIIGFSVFMEKKTDVFHGKNKPEAKNADPQYILSIYDGWTRRYIGQGVLVKEVFE